MSIQLALLKSGEEVIADIKEYRDSDDILVSYLFKDPYTIKIKASQLLVEDDGSRPKHEAVYYKWMALSKDSDIIVNKDWIVCITDPIDQIKNSYEERLNGRDGSTSGRDGSTTRREPSGSTTETSSGTLLTEQLDSDSGD